MENATWDHPYDGCPKEKTFARRQDLSLDLLNIDFWTVFLEKAEKAGKAGKLETAPEEPVFAPALSWSPPLADFWKVNVEASFHADLCAATLGAVVRDSHGSVLVCAVKEACHVKTPLQAELLAILYGTEVAHRFEFKKLVVESDSMLAIKETEKKEQFAS
ncbi:hypothetical protein DITRI_Ditri08aG0064000 [Diplodiscus trichospermus]